MSNTPTAENAAPAELAWQINRRAILAQVRNRKAAAYQHIVGQARHAAQIMAPLANSVANKRLLKSPYPADVFGRTHTQRSCLARQWIVFILRHHPEIQASFPAIGAAMDRDHTTIINAFDRILYRMSRAGHECADAATVARLAEHLEIELGISAEQCLTRPLIERVVCAEILRRD